MKKAIIITSAIEVNNAYPLTYSATRSKFDSEERFRQTVATLATWDIAGDDHTTIFVIDTSKNAVSYGAQLRYQPNLVFISIKDDFPEIWETVNTHKNKSYCEQTIVHSFLTKYKKDLAVYDFFIKFSGRYLIDGSFEIKYFDTATPGFYFKKPLEFDWSDSWGYYLVDRRQVQGNNKLYQFCSVIYGWSKEYFDQYLDISKVMLEFFNHPSGIHYDVETLLYFFTRQYEDNVYIMPWIVSGWDGTSGRFLRY